MKNLTKTEIDEKCNAIAANGGTPYALVYISGETKTAPRDIFALFDGDSCPAVMGIFENADAAAAAVRAEGAAQCDEMRCNNSTRYFVAGYFATAMVDECGDAWEFSFNDIGAYTPIETAEVQTMKKVLYFEGAGCVPAGEVANCRIRTAFTNDDGKKIYIEFTSYTVEAIDHKKWKRYSEYGVGTVLGFCDYCHYITDDPSVDDCNESCLPCERKKQFIYTYEGIKNFINANCDASFDEIVVLDDLAGYRVFNGNGKRDTPEAYNYGDIFAYDAKLAEKRIAKVAELSEHFKQAFNQEHDNTSYYIENGVLNVCLNVSDNVRKKAGYTNRRFTVEV